MLRSKIISIVFLLLCTSIVCGQSIKLPSGSNSSAGKSKSAPQQAASRTVNFRCDFDATFIFTNQINLKYKKRVVITGNQKKESLIYGGYKVEIEDAQGKKYKASKYLEVNGSLAEVYFYKTGSGFDFNEYTQKELEERNNQERIKLVKSIIDANYARELKATIAKTSVDANSATTVLTELNKRNLADNSILKQFNDLVALMESTHYNHNKLREYIATKKSNFYLDKENYQFVKNVITPLAQLEAQIGSFASFWSKNEYSSIISDDIVFYINGVKAELQSIPQSESDFFARVDKNKLELQKREIAQKRKENEQVEIKPLVVDEIESNNQSDITEPITAKQTETEFAQWWDWKYWDWWEWLLYGAMGLIGALLLIAILLLITDY